MYPSICPFCHLTVPSLELERHANSHFEDEELATDMELAQAIALAPPSPPLIVNNQVKDDRQSETNTRSTESSTSWHDGRTSDREESNIDEKICCLVGLQIRATFHKVEDGLMALLRNCLESDSDNSTSILAGYVDHFQSIESEDIGWGCGWRNIQMLSSHLLMQREEAREVLFGGSGFVPDIASLQRWLEIAWERDFDILGSNHFNHKIYGKRNWIGTTECAALFRSFGLRAKIVDFGSKEIKTISSGSSQGADGMKINGGKRKPVQVYGPMDRFLYRVDHSIPQTGSSGHENSGFSNIHLGDGLGTSICRSGDKLADSDNFNKYCARSVKGHQVLIDWVWNYFSDNRLAKSGNPRVVVSEKAPLYFQHQGHSRTIVGIQVKHQRNGMQQYNLLILDSAHKTTALERSLKENVGWQKLIKRGVHTLKKLQYQLCYIDPGIACGEEMEQLKTLDSVYLEF
uniref:Putative zinc finger with UFM1-specific peptidase domain protein n=2 Tax=Davidia involucrata TaxID=16924 RepID=A0A5B7AG47_DAVIN